jgi:hypothetical protein
VRCDRVISSGEHAPGVLDPFGEGVCVPGGVFPNSASTIPACMTSASAGRYRTRSLVCPLNLIGARADPIKVAYRPLRMKRGCCRGGRREPNHDFTFQAKRVSTVS